MSHTLVYIIHKNIQKPIMMYTVMMRNIFIKSLQKADSRLVQEGFLLIESLSAFLILTCAMLLAAHFYCVSLREYTYAAERLKLVIQAQQESEKMWINKNFHQETGGKVLLPIGIKAYLNLPEVPICKRVWIESRSQRDPTIMVCLSAGVKEVE